jgi:hypothetical protein
MSWRFEDFEACLEQAFELSAGDHREALRLVRADRLPNAATTGNRVAFSIIFESANHDVLPQQLYRLSHPAFGDFELFIVPIADAEQGIRYEAVFS